MIKELLKKYYKLKLRELRLATELMVEIAKYKKVNLSLGKLPFKLVNQSYEIRLNDGKLEAIAQEEELFHRKININNEKELIKLLVEEYRSNPDKGIELMHSYIKKILKGAKS
jgi:hypothetical protein